jgi:hypothetical protein
MRRLPAFGLLTLLLVGCGKGSSSGASSSATSSAQEGAAKIEIHLHDASIDDALTAVRRATGADLTMSETTRNGTSCIHVNLDVSENSESAAIAALETALTEAGLRVDVRAHQRVIGLDYASGKKCPSSSATSLLPPALDPLASPSSDPIDSPGPPGPGEKIAGVTDLGNDHYRVDASDSAVSAYGDMGAFMRKVRITPSPGGARIAGLRSSSLLAQLGFKNGDVLKSVNGFDLTEPDKALEAYAKLRNAKTIEVELTRSGTPHTIRVDITGSASPRPAPSAAPPPVPRPLRGDPSVTF